MWNLLLACLDGVLLPDQTGIDHVQHQRRGEEDRREGGGHAPVDRLVGVEGDEVAGHLLFRAAEQRRRNVVTQAKDEHEQPAGADAGSACGK